MAGLNKIMLIGNLGKDPEIRTLDNGVKVATFSMATSETWKDSKGNKQEKTEWHNIVLWRGLAEVAEKYLKKGNTIHLEGKITSRTWDDKDGNKRYTTEIIGAQMIMLGGKQGVGAYESSTTKKSDPGPTPPPGPSSKTVSENSPEVTNEEDIPF